MPDWFDEPDIIISEMDLHVGGWCDSGHKAPILFRRSGPDSLEEPTRFFKVDISGKNFHGIYCEPCLIIANHVSKLKKQGKL